MVYCDEATPAVVAPYFREAAKRLRANTRELRGQCFRKIITRDSSAVWSFTCKVAEDADSTRLFRLKTEIVLRSTSAHQRWIKA
jgi:hypothetical protein